jgi:hypothetical protein
LEFPLLDFGFAVGYVFPNLGVELFGFEFFGFGALIFGHGVKMTGTGGGDQFDEFAGHGMFSGKGLDAEIFFAGIVVLAGFEVGRQNPHGAHGSVAETDFFALRIGFEGAAMNAGGVQADAAGFFGQTFAGDLVAARSFLGAAGVEFGHGVLLS